MREAENLNFKQREKDKLFGKIIEIKKKNFRLYAKMVKRTKNKVIIT
jgi:hypothetical protein